MPPRKTPFMRQYMLHLRAVSASAETTVVRRGKVINLSKETIMAKQPPKPPEERQRDNRSNQLNHNNDRYYWSRGQLGRPSSEPSPGHKPKGSK